MTTEAKRTDAERLAANAASIAARLVTNKIDILVAEALGCNVKNKKQPDACMCGCPGEIHAGAEADMGNSHPRFLKRYSTDLGAAVEGLTAFHAGGDEWTLFAPHTDRFAVGGVDSSAKWVAWQQTYCSDRDFGDWCEYDQTASMAICKAILKAKQVMADPVYRYPPAKAKKEPTCPPH